MANLPETATYDAGVYQLEATDLVQGGPSGKSNMPGKNLANRTTWLKAQVDLLIAGGGGGGSLALASDAETIAGVIATKAVSPHGLTAWYATQSGGGASGLGVGQSWVNVAPSRAFNTNYQNTSSDPILVMVSNVGEFGGGTWYDVTAKVGATTGSYVTIGSAYAGESMSFVVPPGHFYRVDCSNGPTMYYWTELR